MYKPKTKTWKIAKRLWPYFSRYWFLLAIAIFCVIIVSLTDAAYAYIVKFVIDDIAIKKDSQLLARLPFIIVAIAFAGAVARFTQAYILRTLSQRVIREIRLQLYNHYQRLSLDFYTESSTGDMISRITSDTLLMQHAAPSLVQLFRQPFTMVALMGVAFYQNWRLALIAVATFPFVAVAIDRLGKKIRKHARRGQERIGKLASIIKENISGMRIIKAFNAEDVELSRFAKENEQVYKENIKQALFGELNAPLIEFLGLFAGALVVTFGLHQVIKGQITFGSLSSFLTAVGLMYEPIKKLSNVNVAFQTAFAASERIFEVLDTIPSVKEKPNARELPPFSNSIKFEKVWFKYKDSWVISDLNFEVKRGEKIAIVGSSGAGKTTLVNLVPRFYDVTRGRVLFDGIDCRDVTLKSLRDQIAIVTQDVFLFNDTVANNIAYGSNKKDMDKVISAAKASNAHDFIMKLPNGYETNIGEMGVKLSGGEKQRIAIARAIYKDAPILILDEATSSLDSESESEVQKALDNLLLGRTAFIIAHRLSTVKNADRIIVISNGKIIEEGKHEELIAKRGEYYRLYQIQFSEEEKNKKDEP